jgi:hypothetical protein
MNVFIVKSGIVTDFDVRWINLRAFKTLDSAEAFAAETEKQIPAADLDVNEFVEIDILTLE